MCSSDAWVGGTFLPPGLVHWDAWNPQRHSFKEHGHAY